MRFVREREWDVGDYEVKIARCKWCCEGNNVNIAQEYKAIQTWLWINRDRWHPLTDNEREAERRERLFRSRAEREAYHAAWMERTRTVYPSQRGKPLRDDGAPSLSIVPSEAEIAADLAHIKAAQAAYRAQQRAERERGREGGRS